jgi:hypothetical protein
MGPYLIESIRRASSLQSVIPIKQNLVQIYCLSLLEKEKNGLSKKRKKTKTKQNNKKNKKIRFLITLVAYFRLQLLFP